MPPPPFLATRACHRSFPSFLGPDKTGSEMVGEIYERTSPSIKILGTEWSGIWNEYVVTPPLNARPNREKKGWHWPIDFIPHDSSKQTHPYKPTWPALNRSCILKQQYCHMFWIDILSQYKLNIVRDYLVESCIHRSLYSVYKAWFKRRRLGSENDTEFRWLHYRWWQLTPDWQGGRWAVIVDTWNKQRPKALVQNYRNWTIWFDKPDGPVLSGPTTVRGTDVFQWGAPPTDKWCLDGEEVWTTITLEVVMADSRSNRRKMKRIEKLG
jgi:hypothetical protein